MGQSLQIITSRAFNMPWIKSSWRYGRSDTTVQNWYRAALRKVQDGLAAV
jgi:hypothetical protein